MKNESRKMGVLLRDFLWGDVLDIDGEENANPGLQAALDLLGENEDAPFIPCPYCGKLYQLEPMRNESEESNGNQVTADSLGLYIALEQCDCAGAARWRENGKPYLSASPCRSNRLSCGKCGYGGFADCTKEKCSDWVPNSSAAILFMRGARLAAERREAEQNRPNAQFLAWALTLPEPVPYWEPPPKGQYRYGQCRWCGQVRMLSATVGSEEEANERASFECKCVGAQRALRKRERQSILEQLFPEVDVDVLELLENVADLIERSQLAGGCNIKLGDNVAAKFKEKEGAVTIVRTEKRERQHSL